MSRNHVISQPTPRVHRIISYLLPIYDVAALSRQCRTLHSLCDMVARGKYYRIKLCAENENTDKPLALIMDILKRPILDHYVRKVGSTRPSYSQFTNTDNKEVKFQRDLSKEETGIVRNALRTGGFTSLRQDRVVNVLMRKRANFHG